MSLQTRRLGRTCGRITCEVIDVTQQHGDPPDMTDTSTDITTVVDDYLAAWNERDEQRRAELIERAWAPDGRLIDPPFEGEGHDGISQMAAVMHEHYAGHRFERASGVDMHHQHLRFAWRLVGPDGAVAVAGIDVADLAEDGRLSRVVGFFGDLDAR
jgi:SnoaL-like domain